MPTTVITGRDVTLTINGTSYDAQALSCQLELEVNRQRFETLGGRVHKTNDEDGTLSVELLPDWGTVPAGLCSSLWTAADTAPDTPVDFTLDANGDSWAGQVLPVKPPAGGGGSEASPITLELEVVGTVVLTEAI